ncbi:MAG: futalosine hydrolase [Pseudomonadota bacterium]
MKPDFLVTVASRQEIRPLLDRSRILKETVSDQGRTVLICEIAGRSYKVLITGPGIMNTVQALTWMMEKSRTRVVLQVGIAGFFTQSGLDMGDICLAESERYIHSGLETSGSAFPLAPLPFELIEEKPQTRYGLMPVDQGMTALVHTMLNTELANSPFRVKRLPMITVSTVTATDTRADELFCAFHAGMEAMEGAAAAHVASLYNSGFLEMRAGSNRVGKRDTASWDIPLAADHLSRALETVILKGDLWHPGE